MNPPLISIIMPVYNGAEFIAEAVDSVIQQDYYHWELIIVNDGSTDNTIAIVKAFKDDRVKILDQQNLGVSVARNRALQSARGKFFCFLDADDVLTPNSLSLRLSCFTNPEVYFADGSVSIHDSKLTRVITAWVPGKRGGVTRNLMRLDGKCFFGPTWMIRRDQSIAYKFDEDLHHGEDLFFCMSYAHLGLYDFTPEVVLKYRRSPNSAMTNLVGLATGYTLIRRKIHHMPGTVSVIDRLIFNVMTCKIMFLCFLKAGQVRPALKYLLLGSL